MTNNILTISLLNMLKTISKYKPPKSQLLSFLILLISTCPIFAQEVHFFKEKIVIQISDGHCVLWGEYCFKNSSNSSVKNFLYYPVIVNNKLPFPDFFVVKDIQFKKEIPFKVGKDGILFSIKIPPENSVAYMVEYQQKTTKNEFEYILTSTRFWSQPIDSAEFIIEVPKKFKLKSISLPYDQVVQKKDKLQYIIKKQNFYPDKNLKIKWEGN